MNILREREDNYRVFNEQIVIGTSELEAMIRELVKGTEEIHEMLLPLKQPC